MWVRFVADYNFTPPTDPRVSIAYKEGSTLNVTRACAMRAIELGRAVKTASPRRQPKAAP